MKFAPMAMVAAAAALVASPALAATANPAAPLSVTQARAAAPATHGSKIAAGGTATLVNVGILAALVVGVLLATTGGDDDSDSN